MRLPPAIARKQTRQVARSTRSEIAAKKKLDLVAVVLVGYAEMAPRGFGDNQGERPVRVHTTRDPVALVADLAREHPRHRLVLLEHVWCDSEAHAKRLRAALDQQLLGDEDAHRLAYAWRDMPEPDLAWPIMLADALRSVRSTERIKVYDLEGVRSLIRSEQYR